MLRIAPYGTNPDNDVPSWYRELTGEDPAAKLPVAKWRVDPENPVYAKRFGGMIRAVAARYDGHPDLELVDISIIGAWGEGAGSELLSDHTRKALLDSYLDSFHETPLVIQPNDLQRGPRRWDSGPGIVEPYGLSKRPVGWRVDCLGDMPGPKPRANWGPFPGWSHMLDFYPEVMVELGLKDAWMKAPVTMEACGVMQSWKNAGRDVDYIIDQSLKWHISSFNGKSSAVPPEWWPQVNRWLKKMGYRYVLRRVTYPAAVRQGEKMAFTSWWENKGVAPCYRKYSLALRLKGRGEPHVFLTDSDLREWLPGDAVYNDALYIPMEMEKGEYDLQIAVVDPRSRAPKVRLAIAGVEKDGWYRLGGIRID
jgi:hypothetical protein